MATRGISCAVILLALTPVVLASLRGSISTNVTNSILELEIRPSSVPGCPSSFVDCGTCRCVSSSTCQWCPGGGGVGHPADPETKPAAGSIRPSSIPGCPSDYKDCGECMCVPEDKCQFCPGVSKAEPVATEPSKPNESTSPSDMHEPVAAAKDFCIKASTCDACCNKPDSYCVEQKCWMCQTDKSSANCANCWAEKCMPQCTKCYHSAAPTAAPPVVDTPAPTPSSVPGCPSGYKDCGACRCVPENTCQWCPGAHASHGSPHSSPRRRYGSIRPTQVPFCPTNYKDCGVCLCVPESTCQWCPGVFAFEAEVNGTEPVQEFLP